MNITIIDHVGINIRDLATSEEWYRKIFGFRIIHKWTTTWMIGEGQIRLGLFQRPKATPVEDLDNKQAITHFAFLTDATNFQLIQDKLTELGVAFEGPVDSGIAYSIFFNDPDGHEVEITTYYDTMPEEKNSLSVTRNEIRKADFR